MFNAKRRIPFLLALLSGASLASSCGKSSTQPPESCPGGKCDDLATCEPETQSLALAPAFGELRFSRPTQMVQRPGDADTWFVIEQEGVISRFAHTPGETPDVDLVLDLRARTRSVADGENNETGMFTMAFHPNFDKEDKPGFREVFIAYTGLPSAIEKNSDVQPIESQEGIEGRISRFKFDADGKTIDRDSEEKLIQVAQPFGNHNGGGLVFGPDGFLYIGLGDGGSARDPNENGQNLGRTVGCVVGATGLGCALLGKVLRIDVDNAAPGEPYAIPADNPFADNKICMERTAEEHNDSQQASSPDQCPEIFAYGIRNPWRMSFDRVGGDLWLADVGQDSQEEVSVIINGGNYGWDIREGALCHEPASNCASEGPGGEQLIDPVVTYGRNIGTSITGGHVYRGTELSSMIGQYVFADIASGRLFATLPKTDGTFASRIAGLEADVAIVDFGQAADGELFAVDFSRGGIFKLTAGEVCTDGEEPPPLPEYKFLARDGAGSEDEANAYYASIIEGFEPDTLTLDAWIDEHIDGRETVSLFYRNTADLGFWREMTCTKTIDRGDGGCWVRNWTDHDDPANGEADLGTVAMNVSPEGFTRFYAFAPGGVLSPKAVLDSEGEKFLPRLCTPCHNGQYRGAGSNGDMISVFREFEPSLFELSPDADTPADRDAAEQAWFELNQAARSANSNLRSEALGGPVGIDHATTAINDYIAAMYPAGAPPALDITDDAHIPSSWKESPDSALAAAQAELWTQAVNPTCMGCHRTNTKNFAELTQFLSVGPDAAGNSLLKTYLEMDPESEERDSLSIMPQAELLFDNLISNVRAVEAIDDWLDAVSSRAPVP